MKSTNFKTKGFATKAIHVGQSPDPYTGAVIPPITLSTTFAQSSPGKHAGFEYSRTSNPTRKALEEAVASLEGGKYGFACASGVSASCLALEFLKPGDHLVAEKDLYGGTLRIFNNILLQKGITVSLKDLSLEQAISSIPPDCKMLWLESPTNPKLKLIDIEKVSAMCKKQGALLAVDNTFMSPFFQRPLDLGADLVIHSATKYLSGHSDILAGIVLTKRPDLAEQLHFWSNTLGPVLSPMDSYFLHRSLKTLVVRMLQHEKNALEVAKFLQSHKRIAQVLYPGLPSHPQHALALKQMSGFGGMISCHMEGNKKDVFSFLEKVCIFTLAESLGGVESLIEHPHSMTHQVVSDDQDESLIRLSVGLENIEDLKEDLDQALAR